MRRLVLTLCTLLTVAACEGDGGPVGTAGIDAPDGFEVGVVVEGLDGPTQIAPDGAGGFVVAELRGGEDDGTGRVLRYRELRPDAAEVLVDGLLTPTGVTVDADGRLWIMEQRRLSTGPLDDPGDRTVVLDELPYNGRSEGTLTALAGGGILFDTSGSRDRDAPDVLKPGSGRLWYLAGPDASPVEFATGFKHAYAHVVDADGTIWVTEMSDGRLDGETPPDELVRVREGDDFGYPRCVGDRTPVTELGATDADCSATPRSHALLSPSATPTSVAVAPWDDDTLLIALWNRREIVAVPRAPADSPYAPESVVGGELTPQHLLVDGDRLLVTDFAGGRVLSVVRR